MRLNPFDGDFLFQSTHPSGVRPLSLFRHLGTCGNFNPRTPVGCDSNSVRSDNLTYSFQSTHPSGVRRLLVQFGGFGADFNPRTPVGCDYYIASTCYLQSNFNPRTPVGCDWFRGSSCLPWQHFNPRTPVGCDGINVIKQISGGISIHAPQWGATKTTHIRACRRYISIHAPQWGATVAPWTLISSLCDFNPRTPVGCDIVFGHDVSFQNQFQSTHPSGVRRFHNLRDKTVQTISIHAPQWGATDVSP